MAQECGVGWHQRLLRHCVTDGRGSMALRSAVERLPSMSEAQGLVYGTIQMNKENDAYSINCLLHR